MIRRYIEKIIEQRIAGLFSRVDALQHIIERSANKIDKLENYTTEIMAFLDKRIEDREMKLESREKKLSKKKG